MKYVTKSAKNSLVFHVLICITDKGRKVVEDSVKIFRRIECRMFEGFSENDMKVLGELLDRIYGNLNQEFTDRAQGEES